MGRPSSSAKISDTQAYVVTKTPQVTAVPIDMDYLELCGRGHFQDTLLTARWCDVGEAPLT